MDPETIADAINTLQQSGKILNFGVSNFSASQTALIAKYVNVTANQIEFSLTKPNAMQDGTLDHMMLHNIETLAWSPLGLYFKSQTPQIERLKKVTKQLSKKYEVAEEVILLGWILRHSAKIKPVIGTTTKERIINANLAMTLNLELEDWFWLLEASQGQEVP
jgi:predicted oxidoreductase